MDGTPTNDVAGIPLLELALGGVNRSNRFARRFCLVSSIDLIEVVVVVVAALVVVLL